jgi:hypothetical protein
MVSLLRQLRKIMRALLVVVGMTAATLIAEEVQRTAMRLKTQSKEEGMKRISAHLWPRTRSRVRLARRERR